MVSILGLNKAQVLKTLWENSKAQGMSFLALPKEGLRLSDCVAGKVIKVDFSGDSFDTWGYDRDNGEGAAQRAVDSLRK